MSDYNIKRILVPVDITVDISEDLVKYADFHAKKHSAEMILLYVTDDLNKYSGFHTSTEMLQEELLENSSNRLEKFARKFLKLKDVELLTASGTAYEEIIKVAAEKRVDLVIIGSRHKNAFDRFFMGTTSAKVIRYSPCPVLAFTGKGE